MSDRRRLRDGTGLHRLEGLRAENAAGAGTNDVVDRDVGLDASGAAGSRRRRRWRFGRRNRNRHRWGCHRDRRRSRRGRIDWGGRGQGDRRGDCCHRRGQRRGRNRPGRALLPAASATMCERDLRGLRRLLRQVCCGGSTPCDSNLVCSSAEHVHLRRRVSEPCCGGTTCTAGLSCLNGICSLRWRRPELLRGPDVLHRVAQVRRARVRLHRQLRSGAAIEDTTERSVVNNTPVTNIDASLFKAASVSYNGTFACGVKADATVWCWGTNTYGSLGNGDGLDGHEARPTPLAGRHRRPRRPRRSPASPTSRWATRGYTACAIATGGALWCWGCGTYGQLGTGFKNSSAVRGQGGRRQQRAVHGGDPARRVAVPRLRGQERQHASGAGVTTAKVRSASADAARRRSPIRRR